MSTVSKRFWDKVERGGDNDCWPWRGSYYGGENNGRPAFWLDGKNRYAHRVAWELAQGGPIQIGLFVCHHCDNIQCVNPTHLFLGSAQINHDDMTAKGRRASFTGEKNSQAKLSDFTVKIMRALFFQNGASANLIAKHFNISPSVSLRAIRGITWKHVTYLCQQ